MNTRLMQQQNMTAPGVRRIIAGCASAITIALLILMVTVSVSFSDDEVAQRPDTAAHQTNAKTAYKPSGFQAGMLALYKENRQRGLANLITPDLLLMAYSQIRQQRIEEVERKVVMPAFEKLLAGIRADIDRSLQSLDESDLSGQSAVAANQQFISVLLALLNGSAQHGVIELAAAAEKELGLILAASGVAISPLWGVKLDYSQFQPRGRYSESAQEQRYFRAVRYASSALFAFHPSLATGVSAERAQRNALQATDLVARLQKTQILPHYRAINEALEWQFGPSDDMRASDIAAVVDAHECAAQDGCAKTLAESLIAYAIKHQRLPRIVSTTVDVNQLASGVTVNQALAGWRLLASRFATDNAALQHLLYSGGDVLILDCPACTDVPSNSTSLNGRLVKGYPSLLEIMALFGSREAHEHLDRQNARAFSGYDARAKQAATILQQAQGLEAAQYDLIRSLFQQDSNPVADPSSVQTGANVLQSDDAVLDRLSTASGFWVWQKYLNLLYQKQPYALTGRNLQLSPAGPRPDALILGPLKTYESLLALVELHRRHDADPVWDNFSGLVDRCVQIKKTVLESNGIDRDDSDFLNDIDLKLTALGIQNDQPVVVDIHTNTADARVVEVATLYPRVFSQRSARGAGFQFKEFKVSLDKRLTVENWRRVLSTLARQEP